jgi:glycosyltransferase involved in cell wall biosynthesis
MLNRRGLLNWVSKKGNRADAKVLGDLTLSVLEGEDGKQKKELDKLLLWLKEEYRPDLVQLSNSLLLGMANSIRAELRVPVICAVQGEEIFVDDLEEPHHSRVREKMIEKSRYVDGFVAGSDYYVRFMTDYLKVASHKMHQVPLGLNLEGYDREAPQQGELPFTIGYLARICPEKGLHLLVEAFRRLVEKVGPEQTRLRIAGYLGERDKEYFEGIMSQIRSWGLEGAVDHVGEVDREHKIEFLQSLHVLSVPTIYREPKGLFVLESMACGVPVVQPRHGAFPELIEKTGGGILVDSESAGSLMNGLLAMMQEPVRRKKLGATGRESVRRDYNATVMAENTLNLYRKFLADESKELPAGQAASS